jgi:uncharacterized protein YecE (DUF72 family)
VPNIFDFGCEITMAPQDQLRFPFPGEPRPDRSRVEPSPPDSTSSPEPPSIEAPVPGRASESSPREAGAVHPSLVRFGTSSFSSEDWIGPFYPHGTRRPDFLRYYATQFDAVEVDSTYYAIPPARTVDSWVEKTPREFRFAAKFPRSIVHGGTGVRPDARRLLLPDTYAERDEFLAVMSRLGPRLGPLVLQFPSFGKDSFASAAPFLERLDRFLGDLPRQLARAVEIRNAEWIGPELATVCRAHGAALVLVDLVRMPLGDDVEKIIDPVTADFAYVRLLGDRQRIEAITTTWGREVLDWSENLDRWARLLARLHERQVSTFVFVNNHYAGHAPATLRRLQDLFATRLASTA